MPAPTPTQAAGEAADPAADRTLATARLLPATPAQVYAAMAAPERLARWWGPKGFRNTFHACDPRPGGAWRYTMHGPNGVDYPNESVFEALVPGERFSVRHLSHPHFTLTVELAAEGDGTRLSWRQVFERASVCQAVRGVAGPGNEDNLDRLAAEVARGPG